MSDTNTIVVDALTKRYRRAARPALDGVSLVVRPGVTGVIGPNGAGKTTLMGCMLGFLEPDSGSVLVGGRPPGDLAVRARVGYLPERLVFDRWMRGDDFLDFHARLAGLGRRDREQRVGELLERVGLTAADARRRIATYSRGMVQRLGLAQALLADPDVVLLDEPTTGIDPAGLAVFRDAISTLRAGGATVLLNSHHLDQVEALCDEIVFVDAGRVVRLDEATGRDRERTLRLRFARPAAVALESLEPLDGVKFLDASPTGARIEVADDDAAARAIAALAAHGVAVCEAAPERSRLESLFLPDEEAGA